MYIHTCMCIVGFVLNLGAIVNLKVVELINYLLTDSAFFSLQIKLIPIPNSQGTGVHVFTTSAYMYQSTPFTPMSIV